MEFRQDPLFGICLGVLTWAMIAEQAVSLGADPPIVAERNPADPASDVIKRFGTSAFRQSASRLVYSPDGRWLAAGNQRYVVLLDAKTGEVQLRCPVQSSLIAGLDFSPDGRSLAIVDPQGLMVLEAREGAAPRRTPERPDPTLGYLKFSATSPDRQWRATMPNNQDVGIAPWDQVQPVHRIPFKSGYPHLAMGNEGKWLATADPRSSVVKIWKAPDFKSPMEWKAASASIRALAASPDGQTVYAGGLDGSIQAWNVKEGRETLEIAPNHRTPISNRAPIHALVLSGDSKLLAAAIHKYVAIYETETGRLVHNLPLGLDRSVPSISLAFSPEGSTMAICPYDRFIQLWDVKTGKAIHRPTEPAFENVFATKDRRLFGSRTEFAVSLWNRQTGERETSFPISPWPPEQSYLAGDIVFHGTEQLALKAPDGELAYRDLALGRKNFEPLLGRMSYNLLLSGYNGQALQLFQLGMGAFRLQSLPITSGDRSPRLLWDLNGAPSPFLQWEFSRDGRLLAASFADRSVFLWDTQTGNLVRRLDLDQTPLRIFLNSTGNLLAIAFDESITVWDRNAEKPIHQLPIPKAKSHMVAFGAKEKLLAVSTPDEPIRLFRLETGKEILVLPAPDSRAEAMAFSPDDKSLAVGFQDKTIGLFDLGRKEEIQIFEGHTEAITCLQFDPAGTRLLSGSNAPEVFVWDVKTGNRLSAKTRLTDGIRQVYWRADDDQVVAIDESHRFNLFAALKDDFVSSTMGSSRMLRPHDFSYSKESQFLAVAFHLGIRIMDGNGHEQPFLREKSVKRVEWSADGRVLMIASEDLFGWDVEQQKEAYRIPAEKLGTPVTAMIKSPDGQVIATGHSGLKVCLWDPKTGRLIREIPLPSGTSTESLQFSPDGRLLFAQSRSSYLILEAASGLVWFQKTNEPDPDKSFAVMDRETLLSAEALGTARLWSWSPGPKNSERQSVEQLWEALATTDGPTVARSMLALADGGDETVAFLAAHFPEVSASPEKMIALIKDLENESPAIRRKASENLRSLGKQPRSHLEAALKRENLSPRVRLRIQLLLSAQASAVSPELLAGRAIQLLEWIATPKAQSVLEKWSKELTGQFARDAQTALGRLEQSKQ